MKIMSNLRAFGRNESGASLAEYAVLLAIVAVIGLTFLTPLTTAISSKFTAATNSINGPAQ